MDDQLRIASVTGIDVDFKVAGPGGRSYAFIVDWHIRFLLAAAWLLFSNLIAKVLSEDEVAVTSFVIMAPTLVIYFLYHPILEVAMAGRTPGKRIAGIRIVTADGQVPGYGALLIRNILRLVDCLPFAYALGLTVTLFTRDSVRVGDLAAGTLLVYVETDHGDALANLPSGVIDRLGFEQAELIQDLVERWPTLQQEVRRKLAIRLLNALGAPPHPEEPDAQLLHELRRQLA